MANERNADWYIQVLDAMEELVLVKGDRSRLLWANRAFCETYGMSNEDLFNIVDSPQADPDNTLQYVRDDHQVYTSGEKLSVLEPITAADGKELKLQTNKTAIFGADLTPERTVGVSRVVVDGEYSRSTDRSVARKAVVQTLKDIVEGLPLATVVLDVQRRIVASSHGFEKIARNMNAAEFEVAFGADERLLNEIQSVLKEGGERHYPSFLDDRTQQIFDISIQEWFLPGKQRGGVMLTLNDVTALKKNEAELKTLNEQLLQKNAALSQAKKKEEAEFQRVSTLLNTLSNAVIVSGPDGEVELLNDEAKRVFGPMFKRNDAPPNANDAKMFDSENQSLKKHEKPVFRALSGESVVHELVMIPESETGLESWFDVSARPFRFGETEGAVSVFTNITDRIKMQNELEEFAYISSHDLQEPLRMVSSYLSLLEEEYGDTLEDDALLYMKFAIDGSKRMQRLVRDLLKFSRSDSNEVVMKAVDLTVLFDEILSNYRVAIDEAGAIVEFSGEAMVVSDATAVGQILANLIGNAVKFGHEDRKSVVKVHCQKGLTTWKLSVSDEGIGIPEEFLENCFKIFKRAHHGEKYPGTGIGLALVKRLAARLGGHIHVKSQLNVGTTFTLTLPLRSLGATQKDAL